MDGDIKDNIYLSQSIYSILNVLIYDKILSMSIAKLTDNI